MPGAKKCHPALPALFFFLLFSPGPPGVEGTRAETFQSTARELQGLPRDRRMLLQLLHRALQDRSRRQFEAAPKRRGFVLSGAECGVHPRQIFRTFRRLVLKVPGYRSSIHFQVLEYLFSL
ncbi:hypothetical protein lerEdw1_012548 [Lerista edwardsae]|nr:hypothetical protein lerEdw1_012548 [Lerista edwardsae]